MYNALQNTISGAVKGGARGAIVGGAIESLFALAIWDTINSRLKNNDVSREFNEVMPYLLAAARFSPYIGALIGAGAGVIVGAGNGLYHSMTQPTKAPLDAPRRDNAHLHG